MRLVLHPEQTPPKVDNYHHTNKCLREYVNKRYPKGEPANSAASNRFEFPSPDYGINARSDEDQVRLGSFPNPGLHTQTNYRLVDPKLYWQP